MPAKRIGDLDEALAHVGIHFTTELFKGAFHGFSVQDSPAYSPEADAPHLRRIAPCCRKR